MAKATKNIIPPKPVEPDFTVTLELTKEEAKLVRYVLYVAQALFRKCYARS